METFDALVVRKTADSFGVAVETLTTEQLPAGDVTIRVAYSSVNYKDGLAATPDGKIVRTYPFVPGIDLAGTVAASDHPDFQVGQPVLVTGYDLGVSHFGGYSQWARVPADWVVPLPEGLSLREAMALGTAGFTAALSVYRLLENHVSPDGGPVLVSGATGGVGSAAVSILNRLGFEVIASSRKADAHPRLRRLGAASTVTPDEWSGAASRPLQSQTWAAVVDPVGGRYLPSLLSHVKYGGSVAVSGLTGGPEFTATVFPFILRGVSLLGIDSVYCPMPLRREIWNKLSGAWKPQELLDDWVDEVGLQDLPSVLERILRGEAQGRTVVRL
ncbi:putative quinone oxidoreductase YhfP [Alicyclobacillus contaminans]|uniref:acrylyl-CoA reductase family protein n=1 Tax=Alicyclobacillus contaminans TaxID=392016 RepID=UPI000415E100|nr:acryloyl-CoA reductase [Alicyclobacillus contaminans]GMA48839.1 putative quinone oxidoreductase YhfP [Alicyclobacillus contaminans]